MKRLILVSILLLLLVLLLPLVFVSAVPGDGETTAPPSDVLSPDSPSPSASPAEVSPDAGASPEPSASPLALRSGEVRDADFHFTALTKGALTQYSLADYLPGMLAGEMPASFEPEALKAQAVAARTFVLYKAQRTTARHPDAAVCDDPACCAAWVSLDDMRAAWGGNFDAYRQKLMDAVEETDGQYLSFDGEPILAAFHSSSAGATEDSAQIWSALPYLVSVSSPETAADVPNYVSTVEVAPDDFKSTILAAYPDADLSGAPDGWLGPAIPDGSGRTGSVSVGGVSVPGTAMRTLFSLRSTAFALAYTDGRFLFTVTGFGHGLGMSQYGADVMAKSGSGYAEILTHYYPGTSIV